MKNSTYNILHYRTCDQACIYNTQPCDGRCPQDRFLCGDQCRSSSSYNQSLWWSCDSDCQAYTTPCHEKCPPFMELSPQKVICITPPEPSCRNVSCGGDDLSPHGSCVSGTCFCSLPWFGSSCSQEYAPPSFSTKEIIIHHNEYSAVETLLGPVSGSEPITYSLQNSPSGVYIKNRTIIWKSPRVGSFSFITRASNIVGTDSKRVIVNIAPCYSAQISHVSQSQFWTKKYIWISGAVIVNQTCDGLASSDLPVSIIVATSSGNLSYSVLSDSKGDFDFGFLPPKNLYGRASVSALHPSKDYFENFEEEFYFAGFDVTKYISLEDEFDGNFTKLYNNIGIIQNKGALPLTNLTLDYDKSSLMTKNMNISVTMNSSTTLNPGASVSLSMSVSSMEAVSLYFSMTISANGLHQRIYIRYKLVQLTPQLVTSPSYITQKVAQGKSKLWTVMLENKGKKNATNLKIEIPDGSHIRLVSSIPDILKAQSSVDLTFSTRIPSQEPLGEKSGQMVVTCGQSSYAYINYKLYITSTDTLNLTIIVEDEFTFFAEGNPLVQDSIVTLRNQVHNYYNRSQITNGSILFNDIYEGLYEIYVDSPDHNSYREVALLQNEDDNKIIYVFLKKNTITYSWTVEKVNYTDTYEIEIEVNFETEVPAPVVTLQPSFIDINKLISGEIRDVTMNITNHGLIRADDLKIYLPDIPCFTVTSDLQSYPESLEAKVSFIYPLTFTRNVSCLQSQISTRTRSSGSSLACFFYYFAVGISYLCREPVERSASTTIGSKTGPPLDCPSGGGPGGGNPVYINKPGGGGHSPGPSSSEYNYVSDSKIACRDCINAILTCGAAAVGGGLGSYAIKLSNCLPTNAIAVAGLVFSASGGQLPDWRCLLPPPVQCGWAIWDCLKKSKKRTFDDISETAEMYANALRAFQINEEIIMEVYGFNSTYLNESLNMKEFDQGFLNSVSGDSAEGKLISKEEREDIHDNCNDCDVNVIGNIIERWNITMYNWNNNILEPTGNMNMISYDKFKGLMEELQTQEEYSRSRGYVDYVEMFETNYRIIEDYKKEQTEEEGVCAVVRIKLVQTLAVTREAFEAELEINNDDEDPIENITVTIFITNAAGERSNSKFSIGNTTLYNIDADHNVLAGTTGSMTWLIIPYYEAAPEQAADYYIGGQFGYSVGGETISIELTPTRISVTPDPRIIIHYFWEKYVWGDNPFTEHIIEPSKPFSVVAAIKNIGFGTAYDMSLSSGQPEIVENEKGLLVDFTLIGLSVDDNDIEPKFEANLGDVGPNSVNIINWWLNCTLQGIFKNFSINIKNKNPHGDPKLSIIDEKYVHELFQQVKEPQTEETLYLVREKFTNESLAPDTVYDSTTLHNESVTIIQAEHFEIIESAGSVLATITVLTNVSGPVYVKVNTNIQKKLLVVTSFKRDVEADSPMLLPLDNAWFVNYDYKKNILDVHLFDKVPQNTNTIIYTIEARNFDEIETTTMSTTLTTTTAIAVTSTTTATKTTTSTTATATAPSTITTTTTTVAATTTTVAATTTITTMTKTTATTTVTIIPEFKPNWLMKGKKLGSKRPLKTKSVIACWKKCEMKKACKFIAWNKKNKVCILFKTSTGGKKKNGYYSGPVPSSPTPQPGKKI